MPVPAIVLTFGTATATEVQLGGQYPKRVFINAAAGDTVKVEYRPAPGVAVQASTIGTATAQYKDEVLTGPMFSAVFTRLAGTNTATQFGTVSPIG